MKRFLSLLLVAMMIFSFAACSSEKTETEGSTEAQAPIEADENLLTVTVTLAANLFEGKTEEEIISSAKEQGVKKCVVNEDGSVTYTMSKVKHQEMLNDFEKNIAETNDGFINGENKVASFIKIETNKEFSQFDVFVDSQKFTTWDTMNVMAFYLEGVYYQCLAGGDMNEIDVVVNFIDNETNEVLETASYRKFMDNQTNSETNS